MPKMQFEHPNQAKFCAKCGTKVEVVCPGCGKMNPPGSNFFIECGRYLLSDTFKNGSFFGACPCLA